jgi:hypothetical protein
MNKQELEEQLQHRVLTPKTVIQFSSLLFSTEYTPEDFITKMNAPGNSYQLVDCQKNGLGIWKYSVNTLTGGYIFCILNENQTASKGTGITQGGNSMGIREWFETDTLHRDLRSLVKHGIILGISWGVTYAAALVSNGLVSQEHIPFVMVVLSVINDKLKLIDPDKPWPIVGAAPPKR